MDHDDAQGKSAINRVCRSVRGRFSKPSSLIRVSKSAGRRSLPTLCFRWISQKLTALRKTVFCGFEIMADALVERLFALVTHQSSR